MQAESRTALTADPTQLACFLVKGIGPAGSELPLKTSVRNLGSQASLPNSGLLFGWGTEVDAVFLKKIRKSLDLGPFSAIFPAGFPLSHHPSPENGRKTPFNLTAHFQSSGPARAFALTCLGKPHVCRQLLPSGSPRGQRKVLKLGPEKQNRSNCSDVCIQT